MIDRHAIALRLWIGLTTVAAAQVTPPPDDVQPEQARAAMAQFDGVVDEVRQLGDWPGQAEQFNAMMDHVWRRNGWDSEPDRFARTVARDVTDIPPWEFERRMEKITDLVAQRYRLAPDQRTRFQSALYRETFGLMFGHFDTIAKHAREFIGSRVHRQPLTPEQIARWTRESESLIADSLARVDRMATMMQREADAEQRELMRRDLQGFDRRMNDMIQQRAAWARGEWKPDDWGMQDDPIQNPTLSAQAHGTSPVRRGDADAGPGAIGPRLTPADALPANESTWSRWVRKFIERHDLDPGQQTAIRSILAEMVSRARDYRQDHREEIDAVPPAAREEAEALAPIRRMFDELQARSRALLTEPQRSEEPPAESPDER